MRHFLDLRPRLALVAVAALLAACSQSGSLPSAGSAAQTPVQVNDAGAAGQFEPAGAQAQAVAEPNSSPPCKTFPNICVKQGGTGTLGIKVTCKRNNKPIRCGSVRWFTKTSNTGLKWSFKPNPGNPTTETIAASKTIKVGQYSQSISAKCSNVPNCPKGVAAAIYVLK